MIYLPSGQEDFKQLRENGNIVYVDKTYFIKEWWESHDRITLISRPHCFGKTLNLSMINYFFSSRYESARILFNNLFICNQNEITSHQNQYPVIYLSFSDLKNGDCEFVKSQIKMKIWEIYIFFKEELLSSEKLDITEKSFINSFTYEMNDYIAIHSIQILSCYLNKAYENRGTIILLDEYDSLFVENLNSNEERFISDEIQIFISNFISSTFSENNFIKKGLITGVTSIALYINKMSVYTMASMKYGNCFGFTKDEVFEIAKLFQKESEIEEIEIWYGGYSFGSHNNEDIVFSPYSIIHFLSNGNCFSNYWFSSSKHIFLRESIKNGPFSFKDNIIKLIQGKSIRKELSNKIILYDYNDRSEESIWIFLLSFGYFSIEKIEEPKYCSKVKYAFKLPNNEIFESLLVLINEMFDGLNEFVEALFQPNVSQMQQHINNYIEYFDGIYDHPENIYHTFILSLAAKLQNSFTVTLKNQNSNGECFYVVLTPLDNDDEQNFIIFVFQNHLTEKYNNSPKQLFKKIAQHEFSNDFPDYKIEDIKKFVFYYDMQRCKIEFESSEQQQQQLLKNEKEEEEEIEIEREEELPKSNSSNIDLNVNNDKISIVRSNSAKSDVPAQITHHYNIRPRNNNNNSNDDKKAEPKEEENEESDNELEYESDDSDDKDKSFKLSIGRNKAMKKKDGFDHRKNGYFRAKDEVYIIDENGYDLWEAIITKNNSGCFYGIHYPKYPQDDEVIRGSTRILRRTPINQQIFRNQEKLRQKSSQSKC